MRYSAKALLVYAQLLSGVICKPVSTSEVVGEPATVTLDPAMEYSFADLEKFHAQQATLPSNPLTVNPGERMVDSEVVVAAEDNTEITENLESLAKNPYLQQKAMISYISKCPSADQDIEQFIVDVSYDGKHVGWAKSQNIDRFGFISSGGGYGKPILSSAKFSHSACRSPSADKVCSYYYSGTLTAKVTALGDSKHIDVDAFKPDHQPSNDAAHLVETCSSTPRDGTKIGCPSTRDILSNRCTVQRVSPTKLH